MKPIHYSTYFKILFLIIMSITLESCRNGDHMHLKSSYIDIINSVSKKDWAELAQKKIYFGHQSVGFNIIDGIKDIMAEYNKIDLKITETDNLNDFSNPLFGHSRIGQNTKLSSKLQDFEAKMFEGLGKKVDVAFFKFCYVDITEKTDIQKLFESYKQTMTNLEKKFPDTLFLHATVPLRTVRTSWKTHLKKMLGKNVWEYADNIKRNEFNKMVRNEFKDSGRLFDIAYAESTYPDGSLEGITYNRRKYATLIPLYTNDGGHLNEDGRKVVAAHLLKLLAEI